MLKAGTVFRISILVNFICTLYLGFYSYNYFINIEKDFFKTKLEIASNSLKYILPPDYNHKITTIDDLEALKYITGKTRKLSGNLRVNSIYSILKEGENYYLSSGNLKQSEKSGIVDLSPVELEQIQKIAPNLKEINDEIYYDYEDEYGEYFAVLSLFHKDDHQTIYIGADITSERLEQKKILIFNRTIIFSFLTFLIFLWFSYDLFLIRNIYNYFNKKYNLSVFVVLIAISTFFGYLVNKSVMNKNLNDLVRSEKEKKISLAYSINSILPDNYTEKSLLGIDIDEKLYFKSNEAINKFLNLFSITSVRSLMEFDNNFYIVYNSENSKPPQENIVRIHQYSGKISSKYLTYIQNSLYFTLNPGDTEINSYLSFLPLKHSKGTIIYYILEEKSPFMSESNSNSGLLFFVIFLSIESFIFIILTYIYSAFFIGDYLKNRNIFSIKFKFVIYIGGTALICFLGISYIFTRYSEDLLTKKTIENCRNIAFNIANIAKEDLILGNTYDATKSNIDENFQSGLVGLKDIFIMDVFGTYVVNYSEEKTGERGETEEIDLIRSIDSIELKEDKDDREMYTTLKIYYPITTYHNGKKIKIGAAIFEYNRDLLYRPIYRAQNNMNWIGLLLVVITLFITLFISIRTTAPITELTRGVQIISEGNLDYHIYIKERDEIGILSEKFNQMTVKIKDYTQNLESMVEQRTKEVVQSKETLQSVLSNSPIILFLLDPKGLILFAEGRGLEKFGVEGSQIIGFKLNDLFNELSDIGNMLEITEFGKEFKREEIIEGIYFEINITALREEKDKVAGYIGLFLDITERKRAETVMARKLFYEEQLALCSQKMIEDKPEVLEEVLEILLKTSNASRVYILKLSNIIVENNLKPEYLFEAINPNSNIQKRNYHFRKSHKNLKNVIMHFKKSLSDEKFINWNLETMPGEFIPFFRKLKIYSILYVPFYIKGEWSGFICFEDNNQPKKWGYEDINLLQTSAGLIGTKMEIQEAMNQIRIEKNKSDALLLNILPSIIADELKENGEVKPVSYSEASILFTDFKGFTRIASKMSPEKLIDELNGIFSQFDQICERRNIEKLKTIGDAFMCAGGLPIRNSTHPIDICLTALEMQEFLQKTREIIYTVSGNEYWDMRIGIHTGSVVAGVIGKSKFAYDIWGDSVNIASRMESNCEVGKINISVDTYNRVKDYFVCERRGEIEVKNRGLIEMFFLHRLKPELSKDIDGRIPNQEFYQRYEKLVNK